MNPADTWGPFACDIEPAERRARLRALRAIVHVYLGPRGAELGQLLHQAEHDDVLLDPVVAQLDALPSLDRRRILASYAAISSPSRFGRARPSLRPRPHHHVEHVPVPRSPRPRPGLWRTRA